MVKTAASSLYVNTLQCTPLLAELTMRCMSERCRSSCAELPRQPRVAGSSARIIKQTSARQHSDAANSLIDNSSVTFCSQPPLSCLSSVPSVSLLFALVMLQQFASNNSTKQLSQFDDLLFLAASAFCNCRRTQQRQRSADEGCLAALLMHVTWFRQCLKVQIVLRHQMALKRAASAVRFQHSFIRSVNRPIPSELGS